MRDISDSAVRKTVEENQDLRRQVLIHLPTVYTRVFLKGHFVKKKNVHPTT